MIPEAKKVKFHKPQLEDSVRPLAILDDDTLGSNQTPQVKDDSHLLNSEIKDIEKEEPFVKSRKSNYLDKFSQSVKPVIKGINRGRNGKDSSSSEEDGSSSASVKEQSTIKRGFTRDLFE